MPKNTYKIKHEAVFNKEYNETNDPNGAHQNPKNWRLCSINIKVHPTELYCRHKGLDCQYLRFKDSLNQQEPFCLWNFEYRGDETYKNWRSNREPKGPLKWADNGKDILKAGYCRYNTSEYGSGNDTWENTTVYERGTDGQIVVEVADEADN